MSDSVPVPVPVHVSVPITTSTDSSATPSLSRHSIEIQILKTKLSQLNNDIDDDRVSHNRAITFNETYMKTTMEYLNIFAVFLISALCAYFFYKVNLISMMLIVVIIAFVILIILFSKIQKRDNIYYDEIDPQFAPPEKRIINAPENEIVKPESKVVPSSYCGCQCCSAGTVWNAASKTCMQGFTNFKDAYLTHEKKKCSGIYKSTTKQTLHK